MKKIIISAAVASLFATSAIAGSLVVPEMEPMVEVMEVEEAPAGTFGGLLVPLLALAALALLIGSSDSSSATTS